MKIRTWVQRVLRKTREAALVMEDIRELATIERFKWSAAMREIVLSGAPVMMAGPWSLTNPPELAGGYTNWRASSQQTIPATLAGIVCVPITHDWGPFKLPTLSPSWAAWQKTYGSDDTPGSRAVKLAFLGEGLPGYGGAGQVLTYRFGGTAASKSAITLQNTTPAAAAHLTAKYEGTRANRFKVTIRTNAADATKKDLLLYDGATLLESYTWTTAGSTALAGLAAVVNAESQYVVMTVSTDAVPLANITGVSLTGGNDGSTLLAADWTDMLDDVSPERFAFFAPFDLTDASIQASITAWIQGLNNAGKRVDGWLGGDLNEAATDAITRAQATNDPNVNTLGVGSVVDYGVIGTPDAPVVLSTSQAAPRAAGIHASRGALKSLTFARLPGWDTRVITPTGVVSGQIASQADALLCVKNGVIPITRDSNPASPLRLEKAVTTWQKTNSDPDRPYDVYKNPRFVKIMQDFEMAITEFAEQEAITPGLPMTPSTKEFVVGFAQNLLADMQTAGLIQPGAQVGIDETVPQSPTDDFLALAYNWYFGRSLEQVRNTITVS